MSSAYPPLVMLAARTLSVLGHPGLLVPASVAVAASGSEVAPQMLPVALGTAVGVAVVVAVYSLWQVRRGRWVHIDASQPGERHQLNLFLAGLLCATAALLALLGQPRSVALGLLLIGLLVALTHLLRRWLKVSLHAACALFSAALVWPHPVLTPAIALLAIGVAWSRVVLGRHTPTEVGLGLLFGAAGGVAFRVFVV